jgi:predicted MFS family arabinose efflux permease
MLISWLFVGRLPGVLLASLVLDRVSGESALVVTSLLLAVLFSLVPGCTQYVWMACIIVLTGAATGFMGVGKVAPV